MVEKITEINAVLNSFAWGPVMLVLLIGTGIFLTVKTNWLQVNKFSFIMKNTVGKLFQKKDKNSGEKNISAFQAVSTAIGGTVGTGSIAGVTGALFAGGPGAVFWMWFAAFFGMVTKYSEILLALKYREVGENGLYKGGPMYYIKNGLGKKWIWLGTLFAIFGGLTSFGTGNMAQSAEISGALNSLFGLSPIVSGILIAVLTGIVTIRGISSIGAVTSYLVPFMSILYILAGILMVILRLGSVPGALATILKEAFSLEAVEGGFMGIAIMNAMKQGFARGVFSNEAGLGSAPMAHAASSTKDPVQQAMWGVFEVFITMIICTITALALILSGILETEGGISAFSSNGVAAAAAFNAILPGDLGGIIIQVSLLFFSFSTILGWNYYGEICWGYLSRDNKAVIMGYRVLFVAFCVVGALGSASLVWSISDTLNGFMAIPNLIALLLLSPVIVRETQRFFK